MPTYNWFSLFFAALLLTKVAGCGGSPPAGGQTDDPPDPDTVNVDAFVFPGDTNPSLGRLPSVPGELLVESHPGADTDCLAAVLAERDATLRRGLPQIRTSVVAVEPAELRNVAAHLAVNPLVEQVRRNRIFEPTRTPDDPHYPSQYHLERLGIPTAWDVTTGAEDIVIAVLDTGITASHPDLASRLLSGWNAFDDNGNTDDVAGHGTSVAGVAAAIADNSIGVSGVSWSSPILPVRVTNSSGQATSHAIAAGIVWAADHGARVINISFAPLAGDETIAHAARYAYSAGALVFASAGNDGQRIDQSGSAEILFVGATNRDNDVASFSTYGPFVDLVAPGVGIWTTAADGGYSAASGTSFSSPALAGVAALVWSLQPEARPATIEQILIDSAVDLGSAGKDDRFGAGLPDSTAAVMLAIDTADEDDDAPPAITIISPMDGQPIDGVITLAVDATDEDGSGLADVVLLVDGVPFTSDASPPYRFVIDSNALEPGTHTLSCIASDLAGNVSAPAEIRVTVGSTAQLPACVGVVTDVMPPTGVINYPVDGSVVANGVGIRVTATDNAALASVRLLVDGLSVANAALLGTRSTVDFLWGAGSAPEGPHTIEIELRDAAGNVARESIVLIRR